MDKFHPIPELKGVPILGLATSVDPNAPVQCLMWLARDLGPSLASRQDTRPAPPWKRHKSGQT